MAVLLQELWTGSGNINGKVPNVGGGTWSVIEGSATYSGGLARQALDANATFTHSATFTNFKTTVFTLNYGGGGGVFTNIVLYFRYTNDSNNYRLIISSGFGNACSLGKTVAGAFTSLGAFNSSAIVGTSIQVNFSSSTITVLGTNNEQILQVTDTAFSSGKIGAQLQWTINGEETGESSIGQYLVEDPEADITTATATKIIQVGVSGSIGVGALSQGDVALVAAAVWDKLAADHTLTGSFGKLVQKLLTVAKFLGLK